MIIYGVAFLAFCTLTGVFIGELLGKLIARQLAAGEGETTLDPSTRDLIERAGI